MDLGSLYAVLVPQSLDHGLPPELSRHLPQVGATAQPTIQSYKSQLISCRGIVASISTEFDFKPYGSFFVGVIF